MLTFHSSYALRKHKQTVHQSRWQSNFTFSTKVDLVTVMGDHAKQQLREELRKVEHFFVDFESIRGKQHVFNLVLTDLSPAVMAGKLRLVFANFDNTAKIIVTLCFVIHNIESSHYCYWNAHKNSLVFNTSEFSVKKKTWQYPSKISLEEFVKRATQLAPNTK